jgi:hypothetical protein
MIVILYQCEREREREREIGSSFTCKEAGTTFT